MNRTYRTMLLVSVFVVAACSGQKQEAKKPMTQHQRDSAIGASSLPGAAGVRGALKAQDAIERANNRLDSIR
jgi:hypothetical protein